MEAGTIYRVVNPSGEPVVGKRALNPRLDALDGKRVGFLWNRVFRGDETLPLIGELLRERFPTMTVIPWDDFPVTSVPSLHAARQSETLAALTGALLDKRVDAVIAGNAG
jgi:hypothetical protein